jgi:alanine dehydrogenase
MRIGVPREIKDGESRVGMTPAGVAALAARGHRVLVERDAGSRVGFGDTQYAAAGAEIAGHAADVYACDLVVKVKELQRGEFGLLRPGLAIFCYQHLAPDPMLLDAVLKARVCSLAYETVTAADGSLPLLAPMSKIAGRLAIQVGMWALQTENGGSGVLLPGVEGVNPGNVVVLGAGNAGTNAAQVAAGIGARTSVFARTRRRLDLLDRLLPGGVETLIADSANVAGKVRDADLVVGAVLTPGRLSPKLLSRAIVASMRPGSVIVDIGIDQGGIAETSRPTSHSAPLYREEGVLHYCVPNMPAACARTATLALTAATLPYVLNLADHGLRGALERDSGLGCGLQTAWGHVTYANLAADTGRPAVSRTEAMA